MTQRSINYGADVSGPMEHAVAEYGDASAMHVTGRFQQINVDLTLAHQGPLLANLGTGILPFYGDINYEYALPNMKTSGSVVVDGKPYQVAGTSWFDRQWGQMGPSFWVHMKWTWMGISQRAA
jgi:predicted secreted hydrolase